MLEAVSGWLEALVEVFRDQEGRLKIELIGGILAAAIISIFWRVLKVFIGLWRTVRAFFAARQRLLDLTTSLARLRKHGRWSEPVLSAERALQARQRDSIPVLMVANLKGGVGKTTLALNLGAYFAARRNKRVLFIDLDFQGTMSSTLTRLAGDEVASPRANHGRVTHLLADPYDETVAHQNIDARGRLRGVAVKTNDRSMKDALRDAAFFPTTDALADLEDWLMISWSSLRAPDDVRFRLARFLMTERVQRDFDLVILDAPPRDTTAGVNGLCAATHLVVPTKSDAFSTDGAFRFVERVAQLRERLTPHIRLLGFVTTMTDATWTDGRIAAEDARPRAAAERSLVRRVQEARIFVPGRLSLTPLRHCFDETSTFDVIGALYQRDRFQEHAGQTISYLEENDIRKIVDPIGDAVWRGLFPKEAGDGGPTYPEEQSA